MGDQTQNSPVSLGRKLGEGKTKILRAIRGHPGRVAVISKDDITGGDGKRHDVVPGKGEVSNRTTCNVFHFLKRCGVPVAYEGNITPISFAAKLCAQLPIEAVVRRRHVGSSVERHPYAPKLNVFGQLVFECFLKTSGKVWKGKRLPCDDPLMRIEGDFVHLYNPHKPIHGQETFRVIPLSDVLCGHKPKTLDQIKTVALRTFRLLEKAYALQNFELIDMKVEFGFYLGDLYLMDVIDAESIRLRRDGQHYDKQPYREGGLNPDMMSRFREVLRATEGFHIPRQQLIIWRGSPKDDISRILDTLNDPRFPKGALTYADVVQSMHKRTMQGLLKLAELVQTVPQSVVLDLVGMSNGAGPTLAGNTHVPVINSPASFSKFPGDVWSSLRTPSEIGCSTVLNPANAFLNAIQILALTNPLLYEFVRSPLEERLVNVVPFVP